MRIKKFKFVTQITFSPRILPVNCYLVEEQNSLTLIDAGLPIMSKAIFQEIVKSKLPLKRIILTHAHGDHIGAVPFLLNKFPDVEVLLSDRELAIFNGNTTLLPDETQSPIKGSYASKPPFPIHRTLRNHDKVGSLQIVAAPGHTPGMIACLDTRTGTLFAGDAFQTVGRLAVAGQFVMRFPLPALATWCYSTSRRSAAKLIELNPSLLLVGHGDAVENPVPLMRAALGE